MNWSSRIIQIGFVLTCALLPCFVEAGEAASPLWRTALVKNFAKGPHRAIQQTEVKHPEARLALAIVADWVAEDAIVSAGGLRLDTIGSVIDEAGQSAARLRSRFEELTSAAVRADDSRWAAIYLDACEARRNLRLANCRKLASQIVFTKHFDMGGSHYAYTEAQSDAQDERHFEPGASLCLLKVDGTYSQVRTLLDDRGGVIRDPDVSYDGRRILLAWKKSLNEDDYHLYEMEVESGQLRQITSGLGFADYEGVYLPNGDIVFNSTRCVQTVDCFWTEVSNLYTCDSQGRYLRRLSFDQVHTNYPMVTPDGRVIYTRWEYSDRGQVYPQGLFQMNPDGTNQRELYGNNSWFPTSLLHARSIPGTKKVVAIFSGHHTKQQGWLGIVDPSKGTQENSGTQLIAPVRDTPAVHIDRYAQDGDQYQYPYPINEEEFLVALRPDGAKHFGLYFVTIDGRRELLASDPEISCNQPVPLARRATPPIRPSMVDYRKKNASVYLSDVYSGSGLAGIPRGTIKRLRVVALEHRAAGVGMKYSYGPAGMALASSPISLEGSWDVKKVLGTAKVYDDGSAYFSVPARTPIYFQALNEKGHAVQTMRSWITAQPGERVGCVGCHDRNNSAPSTSLDAEAVKAGLQQLELWQGPVRTFSFNKEIQPILDQHCTNCHHVRPGEKSDQEHAAFSLLATQELDRQSHRKWSDAYKALANRKVTNWINVQSVPSELPPYHAGAAKSRLIEILEEGHYDAKLSDEEMDRIATWIDLLVPYCGDYREGFEGVDLAKYQHFLDKRHREEARESKSIEAFIRDRGR